MKSILKLLVVAAAAFLAACGAPAGNSPAANNANTNTAKPVAAAPTKDAIVAIEKTAWEAWKIHDDKFWDGYFSDKFTGFGKEGRQDKAAMVKSMTEAKTDVKSYSLSDEQMTTLSPDVALLTFKAAQDCVVNGKPCPKEIWVSSIYVREGDKWKNAYYNEVAVIDPKAAPAKPADKKEAPKKDEVKSAAPDAVTDALVPVEKAVWEAWKDHDGKKIDELLAKDISFINIFGTFFSNKADALKDWTSPGCDVKSVSVTAAAGKLLSPTVGILTFKGGADGTCFGQRVGPIWGTSVYVKDGDTWEWAFGMNIPAQ